MENIAFSLSDLLGALIEAESEEAIIRAVMRAGQEILGAEGCAFIPFAEWKVNENYLVEGQVPQSFDAYSWEERLGLPATRQVCKHCIARVSDRSCLLFADSITESNYVFCLPLHHPEGKEIGIVSFFLYHPPFLTPDVREKLNAIQQLAAKALARVQRSEREMEVLRQVLRSVDAQIDLKEWTEPLLGRLLELSGADCVVLWDQTGHLASFPPQITLPPAEQIKHWWKMLKEQEHARLFTLADPFVSGLHPHWVVLPLRWKGETEGLLLLRHRAPLGLSRRLRQILQVAALQWALLLHYQHMLENLEYQTILEERTRLAREIHDGIAQTLAFLQVEIGRLQLYLNEGRVDALSQGLQTFRRTLNDAFLELRLAIDQLRHSPHGDWSAWLRETAEGFSRQSGIETRCQIASLPGLPSHIQAQLSRIVQEALTNVWKHAQARSVTIRCYRQGCYLQLEITDDGRGFDTERKLSSQHGLQGMRERAVAVGADLRIFSAPGAGTTVQLSLNLKKIIEICDGNG